MGKLKHRGAVTCKVLHSSASFVQCVIWHLPTCWLLSSSFILLCFWKIPKWLSRWPSESRLMLLIWLDAFKEIIDVCWLYLCIFAGNQCDETEGSAGISKGRRSLKASLNDGLTSRLTWAFLGLSNLCYLGSASALGTGWLTAFSHFQVLPSVFCLCCV